MATAIALLDVLFILVAVPESLPEKVRPNNAWTPSISWEQADPFQVKLLFSYKIIGVTRFHYLSYKLGWYQRFTTVTEEERPMVIWNVGRFLADNTYKHKISRSSRKFFAISQGSWKFACASFNRNIWTSCFCKSTTATPGQAIRSQTAISTMCQQGICRPSKSPWASPLHMVKK